VDHCCRPMARQGAQHSDRLAQVDAVDDQSIATHALQSTDRGTLCRGQTIETDHLESGLDQGNGHVSAEIAGHTGQ
jgi:hypothetical protein